MLGNWQLNFTGSSLQRGFLELLELLELCGLFGLFGLSELLEP